MAMWTMRLPDTRTQDAVTLLVAVPAGSPGFCDQRAGVDLVGRTGGTVSGVELVGRVFSGSGAVERGLELMPDVMALHTAIDDFDARTVCRRLQEWAPAIAILALSPDDDERLYTTVATGASSALTAITDLDLLAESARRLARGETLLPPRVAGRLLNDVDAWAARSSDPLYPPPALTSTEREVLANLASGESPAQIAEAFGVTSHLVNVHAGYAVAKLHRYLTGAERLAVTTG